MLLTCYSNVRSLHRHAHTCSQKKPTEITKNMCLCLCVRVCGSKLYIHEASTTMGPQASSTESIRHMRPQASSTESIHHMKLLVAL